MASVTCRVLRRASAPIADLAALRNAVNQARAALRALEAEPSLGTASAYDELGSWPLLAELAARAEDPDVIARLASARGADALLGATTAFLSAAGDVSAAASALHVHCVTLTSASSASASSTGVNRRKGEDPLLLHVLLRLARLRRSG